MEVKAVLRTQDPVSLYVVSLGPASVVMRLGRAALLLLLLEF